jgi:NAD(P)-dependent dehydrogenase (short-subunit alcohol dehydrogenase family)
MYPVRMAREIIVITGGAGALGSTLARTLVARGDGVVLLDIPQAAERLAALAKELACVGIPTDVRSGDAWNNVLAQLREPPTGAALIAGGWAGGADEATWEKMHAMNVDTAYRSFRALLPGFVARKRGSIVVVGSRAVERPWESANAVAYAASKSAVIAMARATAAEVLNDGVRINAVLPSTIDTPANRAAMPDVDPGKWVSGESLASVIAFLLSDAARDVSGAVLPVYGRA